MHYIRCCKWSERDAERGREGETGGAVKSQKDKNSAVATTKILHKAKQAGLKINISFVLSGLIQFLCVLITVYLVLLFANIVIIHLVWNSLSVGRLVDCYMALQRAHVDDISVEFPFFFPLLLLFSLYSFLQTYGKRIDCETEPIHHISEFNTISLEVQYDRQWANDVDGTLFCAPELNIGELWLDEQRLWCFVLSLPSNFALILRSFDLFDYFFRVFGFHRSHPFFIIRFSFYIFFFTFNVAWMWFSIFVPFSFIEFQCCVCVDSRISHWKGIAVQLTSSESNDWATKLNYQRFVSDATHTRVCSLFQLQSEL